MRRKKLKAHARDRFPKIDIKRERERERGGGYVPRKGELEISSIFGITLNLRCVDYVRKNIIFLVKGELIVQSCMA